VKPEVDTASALPEWTTAVARELGLESAADDKANADTIAGLASHVIEDGWTSDAERAEPANDQSARA
jgi:hypothetical protein